MINKNILYLLIIPFVLGCTNQLNIVADSDYKNETHDFTIQEKVKGEIIRSEKDSVNLIFKVSNFTASELILPKELGTRQSVISFTTPSSQPSKFKNPNGSRGIPIIVQPNESYSYEIPNYEHFMITLSGLESDQIGWFTMHWTMEELNIKESISLYFDRGEIIKKLD